MAKLTPRSWAVYVVDRCGASATGFPAGLRDEDITTPFPRPMPDIVSVSAKWSKRHELTGL